LQDEILQGGIGAPGVVRGGGAIGPIDTAEALAFAPLDPEGDGGDANAEVAGDFAERLAFADGGYHGPTTLGLTLCLLMGLPLQGSVLDEL
jgi:hypothetical protein